MASISHSFTTTNPHLNLPHNRSSLLRLSSHSFPRRFFNNLRIFAQHSNSSSTSIDFNDPDWKIKFQQDFESRFRLPHITDIFPDTPPIPSTFCLKMRFLLFSLLI
jgi:6-phosphofructokinase 1